MSQKQFLQEEAKVRAVEAIKSIELKTSAEIVVSVRARSGDYRAAAYQFGLCAMGLTLLVLFLIPTPLSVEVILIDALSALLVAIMVALLVPPVLRRLVRRSTREQNSRTMAHALFHEQGIARTSGRNGLLVFVSLFERQCVVATDIGIDEELLGEPWQKLLAELSAAVQKADLDAFLDALVRMGPILGAAMPRMEDDVNELADEVC